MKDKNRQIMAAAVLTAGHVFLSSCSSSPTKESEIHDGIESEIQGAENSGEGSAEKPSSGMSSPVRLQNKNNELQPKDWMGLFQKPPTFSERKLLHTQVKDPEKSIEKPELLLARARKFLALGKVEESRILYYKILENEPKNRDATLELAMGFVSERQYQKALDLLREIRGKMDEGEIPNKSYMFKFRYLLALNELLSGDPKKAHGILTDLIGQDKTFTPGYAALASSYFIRGQYEVSEFIVRRAMERGPTEPSLMNLMGLLELKKGLQTKAMYWFDQALAHNPEFTPAMINKAALLLRQYRFTDAQRLLKESLSLNPSSVEAHIILSAVYMGQDRVEDARSVLENVLKEHPRNSRARYHLGLISLYGLKKPFRALRYFEEAVQSTGYGEEHLRSASLDLIGDIRYSRMIRK